MPRETQVEKDGFVITVEWRGTSSGISIRLLSWPWVRVQTEKDHTIGETTPRGLGTTVELSRQSGLKLPGILHASYCPNYT